MHTTITPARALALSLGVSAALVAGCSSGTDTTEVAGPIQASAPAEASRATPRLTVGYDGGVLILDATTLAVVGQTDIDGFTRLNPAGDGRHVMISTDDAFKVLDAGTWAEVHGDHLHYYTADPALTEIEFAAGKPGHVVRHADRTVLFNDGSGLVESFDPHDLADGKPETRTYTTPQAHHGVAVELSDGGLITTIGDSESRNGIAVLDRDRKEIARNEQCPGIHGEAVAGQEVVAFGCQDGLLTYRNGVITKIDSPDTYGRIGNQAGSEASDIVLGDYKTDEDAELERPTRVALVNTTTGELKLVELGTSYTFRSLGRGPHGEGIVLGTDGALHVIDQNTGAMTARIPVIDEWTEPAEWQEPRPALFVQGSTAYVTDPTNKRIHAVDLEQGIATESTELPQVPRELTGVSGR